MISFKFISIQVETVCRINLLIDHLYVYHDCMSENFIVYIGHKMLCQHLVFYDFFVEIVNGNSGGGVLRHPPFTSIFIPDTDTICMQSPDSGYED